ncbi:MAG: alpha-L-fucosidase [Clostridia bacterium]|nr:alpha-L-fucosidase [Clostridia bacterium]
MEKLQRIENFEKLGMGMFVHFGLFSVAGKGEWYCSAHGIGMQEYVKLFDKFKVKKTWAKELVSTAKKAGAKYITLTTRHHEGFSLFDTCGLNEFDAPHSPTGRDLVKEFVDECNRQGIVPFFYHTLLDWHHPDYKENFPKYLEYLRASVEILCKNYGKIGGLWFDGWWDKKDENWEFDELYALIRRYQPDAMIINNTGLSELGKVGHYEIDSVTFERGKPTKVDQSDKIRAGEMCQVLNDHWGYAKEDMNYKTIPSLLNDLIDCRLYNCNFLLNVGPMGDGKIRDMDKATFTEIGNWIRVNKKFIYNLRGADIEAENAKIGTDGKCYYAIISDVAMASDPNVAMAGRVCTVKIKTDKKIKNLRWLDTNELVSQEENGVFKAKPFQYGTSRNLRVARFEVK